MRFSKSPWLLVPLLVEMMIPVRIVAFTSARSACCYCGRVKETRRFSSSKSLSSGYFPFAFPSNRANGSGWKKERQQQQSPPQAARNRISITTRTRMSSSGSSSSNNNNKGFEKEMRDAQTVASQKVSSSVSKTEDAKDEHNSYQAAVFNEEASLFASGRTIPDQVVPTLRKMAETMLFGSIAMRDRRMTTRELELRPARPKLTNEERDVYHILDVGCGTGALFDYYLEAAEKSGTTVHIHGLDLSQNMLEGARRHGEQLLLGGTDGTKHTVRVDQGDICDWQAPKQYDLVVANACFANFFDLEQALTGMTEATRLDGWLCITHPLGSKFVQKLHNDNSTIVPHVLPPALEDFRKMARTLPLQVVGVVDKVDNTADTFYMANAIKTVHRTLPQTIRLRGSVATGYGRGGKKLGFPTANLPSSLFQKALEGVDPGVYFGWAVLEDDSSGEGTTKSGKKGRNTPLKAVVNVGYSPTFEGQENKEKIVEAHIILKSATSLDPTDFYGETMRLQLCGFIRGEIKFPSFPDLIAQITTDVQDAKDALDYEEYQKFQNDPFLDNLVGPKDWVGSGGGDQKASWEFEDVESVLSKISK